MRRWGGGWKRGQETRLPHAYVEPTAVSSRSGMRHMPLHRFRSGIGNSPSNRLYPIDGEAILLCKFVVAMSSSPSPILPSNWPFWTSSSLSHHSLFSPAPCVSRFNDLLAKFPLPPQGRNIQNQIGLFPAIYTVPYQPPTPSTSETQPCPPTLP